MMGVVVNKAIRRAWVVCLLLGGCAAPLPSPDSPDIDIPAAWRNEPESPAVAAVSADWWQRFDSSELTTLIDQARLGSFDIAVAIVNVQQARLRAQIVGADVAPQLSAAGSMNKAADLGAHLDASYEMDFWGRNRALRAGAAAKVRASEFDRATVTLTITSEVALAYVQTLWLRQQEQMARLNLDLARQVMGVVNARHRAGAATRLEVTQQQGVIVALRRSILSLRQRERDSVASLAALLGVPSQQVEVGERNLESLSVPSIDSGLPSELLARRPDIASIEEGLRAADADIALARAALFPSFSLTSGLSSEGDSLPNLLDSPAHSLAAAIAAPIFNSGRLMTGQRLAIAQKEALLGAYRASIVSAFTDVEIMLNAHNSIQRERVYQEEAEKLANEAFALAESRYRAGAADLMTLLDAQRTLYQAREARVQLHRDQLRAAIGLFKALGGGWSRNDTA